MNFSPNFLCFLDLTKCLGAASNPLAGRMRPAGRVFEVPAIDNKMKMIMITLTEFTFPLFYKTPKHLNSLICSGIKYPVLKIFQRFWLAVLSTNADEIRVRVRLAPHKKNTF
jgi:hypothetical protein